jgi:predicted deacylase
VTTDLSSSALPLTYDECRARFQTAAALARRPVESHVIARRGPDGQRLSIDAVSLGATDPSRLLVVLSGVHGVEGFIGSALQTDLLRRVEASHLPPGLGILLVHAVNPWGMAWWRRENESNVDLNRNWRRNDGVPVHNDAYDEIHHLACPATPEMPEVAELMASASAIVAERGVAWVRDAITTGQYRHPDGLHYGGEHTEQSNLVLESIARERILGRDRVLVLDLHTGHGPPGEITLLSDQPPDSAQHRFFTRHLPWARVEATVGNPSATTGRKSGQIANGIRDLLPPGRCWATSAEVGTTSDIEQLTATYQSAWVHRHGDLARPEHRAAIWAYRCCFTPDDPEWERQALDQGRRLLDDAVTAMEHWDRDDTDTDTDGG